MAKKQEDLERIAAAAGANPDVVEKLDRLLTGPNDRAYLVCTFMDCTHNLKGECSIYTVHDVLPMKTGVPCERYKART